MTAGEVSNTKRSRNPLAMLRPSASHSASSAAILLMLSALLSGVLGLVRIKVINALWGAGPEQDAYRAAFKLPDLLSYFLIGGAASISLITVLNRYREAGDEEGGDRALSVILTTMLVVLGSGVLLAEIFAPQFIFLAYKGFRTDPLRASYCITMTRIILPAQIFFFIGSVMAARLQVRKIFIYQAFAPLIYNAGIILGALVAKYVTSHSQAAQPFAIRALPLGVLAGMFVGYGLLNTIGALRTGLHYRPIIGFRDPAFLEWLKLSLPLMIGVSLVMFDGIFLNYFGSLHEGGITLLGNAKDLFNAPFNVIGPAAGAASLPFFASIFQQNRMQDFSSAVTRAVSRLFSVGMLVSAWMIALAPWLMDLFRGGHFRRADAAGTTQLFVILAGTLAIWSVQGIYARAFYAASDTKTPAITGTIITVLSAPIYAVLFRLFDLKGLALASDIGIFCQTATLAVLLHRRKLVNLVDLEWTEFARTLLASVFAGAATWGVSHALRLSQSHFADVVTIAIGSLAWAVIAFVTLRLTGSRLITQLTSRF